LYLVEIVNYHKHPQINEDEMGGACGMYRKEQKCIQDSGERLDQGRTHMDLKDSMNWTEQA
jgi:hypothetical protein